MVVLVVVFDCWFYVQVDEVDGVEVSVNLLFLFIELVFRFIFEDVFQDVNDEFCVEFNDVGFLIDELCIFWDEICYGQDVIYLMVCEDDYSFVVKKFGDYLFIEFDEMSEMQIDVCFLLLVVDVFFLGFDNCFDFGVVIQVFVDYGEGDMVIVCDGDSIVCVWVDFVNVF